MKKKLYSEQVDVIRKDWIFLKELQKTINNEIGPKFYHFYKFKVEGAVKNEEGYLIGGFRSNYEYLIIKVIDDIIQNVYEFIEEDYLDIGMTLLKTHQELIHNEEKRNNTYLT